MMKKNLIFSFAYIGKIGLATAVPLLLFAALGRYLDNLFGTSPYLLAGGILLATFFIFGFLKNIVQLAREELKDINS